MSAVRGDVRRDGGAGGSREVALAWLGTLVVGLIRWAILRKGSFCGTPDSCTYLALAESLSRHRGFTENFLYQYQFVSAHLPTHGIEYWRPGTSFFLLLAQPFGGVSLHSSVAVTIVAGMVLAGAAWRCAMVFNGSRRLACAAYLLCLMLPPVWTGGLSPDSALYYGAAVAWFLVSFRVRDSTLAEDVVGLVCIALVSLIRNDALLLLFPLGAVLYLRRRRGEARGCSAGYVAAMLAGFVAANAMIPLLNHAVLGKAFPTGALGAMYLSSLGELSAYGAPVTPHTLLSHGIGALVKIRLQVLPTMLYRITVLVVGFGIIFVPFAWIGRTGGRRRIPELAGSAVFLLVVVVVYSLVLPAVGAFSALRSCLGVLPLTAVLMVCGMRALAADERQARWLVGGVIIFYGIVGTTATKRSLDEMNQGGDALRQTATALRAAGATPGSTVVMTDDASQFSETTGFAAVPIPSNGPAAVAAAIADLHPGFVLVDEERLAGDGALRGALRILSEVRVPAAHLVVVRLGDGPPSLH